MILRHASQRTAMGLAFIQPQFGGIKAVGAAAHLQPPALAMQCHLRLVLPATPGGDDAVPGHTFLRARRRGEAPVEVSGLAGKVAQRAHGHGIG